MINIIADWHTQYYLAYTNAIKTNKDVTNANQSTQTHHKASTQGEQASMHWIWVNAKCKYEILISMYEKFKWFKKALARNK